MPNGGHASVPHEEYQKRAPALWMDSAEKLKRAADVIRDERLAAQDRVRQTLMRARTGHGPGSPYDIQDSLVSSELGDVYYLLAGLCLRNLLKGLVGHAHPEYVQPYGGLDDALKGTGILDDLMKEAGVYSELSRDETTFLHLAETAFGFWGDARIQLSDLEFDIQDQFAWEGRHSRTFNSLYRRWAEKLIRTYVKTKYRMKLPGHTQEYEMTPDEYIQWRLEHPKRFRV
jgi:hypothetical protein